MIDFYYIDLYFDPDTASLQNAVEACTNALLTAGCRFQQVTMASPETQKHVSFSEHVTLRPEDLPSVAAAFAEEVEATGQKLIAFPPLGRIMFTCDFRFDDTMMDEIHEEEEDSNSSCDDIGLTFMCSTSRDGRSIKASLSFWEEYVLSLGTPETHVQNMHTILDIIKNICAKLPPVFGSMNNEIHINTDSSMALLMQGKMPEGNEFTIVGPSLIKMLNMDELKTNGFRWSSLPGGGIVIQMVDKWNGHWAV